MEPQEQQTPREQSAEALRQVDQQRAQQWALQREPALQHQEEQAHRSELRRVPGTEPQEIRASVGKRPAGNLPPNRP